MQAVEVAGEERQLQRALAQLHCLQETVQQQLIHRFAT